MVLCLVAGADCVAGGEDRQRSQKMEQRSTACWTRVHQAQQSWQTPTQYEDSVRADLKLVDITWDCCWLQSWSKHRRPQVVPGQRWDPWGIPLHKTVCQPVIEAQKLHLLLLKGCFVWNIKHAFWKMKKMPSWIYDTYKPGKSVPLPVCWRGGLCSKSGGATDLPLHWVLLITQY